jgi:tetratricopeptide (TPR) repeat protein
MRTVLVLALLLSAFPAAARRADAIDGSFKKIDQMVEKGEYVKARAALDDVLSELNPEDPRLVRYHERTGAAWLREGNIPEARTAFTSALKAAQRLKVSDDSVAKAYAGMGLCLRRENNDSYALKFFKKALAIKLDEGTRMFVEDQIREIEGSPPVPAR